MSGNIQQKMERIKALLCWTGLTQFFLGKAIFLLSSSLDFAFTVQNLHNSKHFITYIIRCFIGDTFSILFFFSVEIKKKVSVTFFSSQSKSQKTKNGYGFQMKQSSNENLTEKRQTKKASFCIQLITANGHCNCSAYHFYYWQRNYVNW